ncbi:MAG: RcpC/CpaB family pilus assembly protein, partial [Chloroflexota bacterium]
MNRRALGLLLIVLVIIAAVILGLFFFLGGNPFAPEPEPTLPPPTIALPDGEPTEVPIVTVAPEEVVEFVEVVISNNTIPRGFQLTENELETEIRLIDQVSPNMITNIEDAVGLFTRKGIFQGETLTYEALASDLREIGQEDFGPSSLIPPGFVAMSVPYDRVSGVGGGIEAGDSVDILISFLLIPVDEEFQTPLHNSAVLYVNEEIEVEDENGEITIQTVRIPFIIEPQGRYEELATGDLANIAPSETQARGQHVAFVIQNAAVIEVGQWIPPVPPLLPTPTLSPEEIDELAESGQTPEDVQVTLSDLANDVNDTIAALKDPLQAGSILIALPPQQQITLKYAIETNSSIDFALRGEGDGQLYATENVSLEYVLYRF